MTGKYDSELYKQARDFMASTRRSIEHLETSGIIPSLCKAVEILYATSGKVMTTGLGKAGHVAAKSASSFSSFGIPSCYLHPAEASHGDVGMIQKGDVMLAFSTSGKTREVIETIELSRKLGVCNVISITSHADSPLRALSDLVIDMGFVSEAGHLSLAPTTSVVVMIVISDMLATLCAWRKGLTIEEFGLRHHGGYLGRKCRGEEK